MNSAVFLTIAIIGLFTYLFRVILFFKLPKFTEHRYIKRGMESIAATMLVALVVPFTLIENQEISPYRNEVYAIILTIFIVWRIKKPNYALLIAMTIYFILEQIFI